jgi:hypothetical protein
MQYFKILLPLLMLILTISSVSWEPSSAIKQTYNVSISAQPDSPLQITSFLVDEALELSRINLAIKNVSDKAIQAFAISDGPATNKIGTSGVTLLNMMSIDQVLQPTETRIFFIAAKKSEEIKKGVEFSVDFIEFSDGKTWGTDYFKSAEQLAGQRAGGIAALLKLREIEKEKGIKALENAVNDSFVIEPIVSDKSENWKMGFNTGAGIVKTRLHRVYQKKGDKILQKELGQPYDASEGRQKQ